MSWNPNQGQDPNQQGAYPNQPSQYGGPTPPPPTNPYEAQQGGYQQQQAPYGQQPPAYGQQPPPAYGQQPYGGYQQPYGGAPMGGPAGGSQGPTSMGMQANVAAGLSYVAGWITGLIFFFGEKQNRFVRFNAMQSILLYAGLTVLYIVIDILTTILAFSGLGILLVLFGLLIWLVGLGGFILWIILMINAFQGKYIKLPIIGDYAEKFANPAPTI